MKKTYKIDVDCANCANKMEDAARKTAGVKEFPGSSHENIRKEIFTNEKI